MMTPNRFWLFCCLTLFLVKYATAQNYHGIVWPEEVDAVVIEEEIIFEVEDINKAKYKVRRLVQVMNEAGSDYGEIQLSENSFIEIKNFGIKIFDLNGKELKKSRKDDILEANISPDALLYNDTRYKYLKMVWPRTPYLIEIAYELEFKSLYIWPDWYPQEDVPVLKSSYTLNLKYPVQFKTYPIGIEVKPRISGNVHVWVMTDIPPRIIESFMPPEHQIQKALLFSARTFEYGDYPGSYDSWTSYAQWYNNLLEDRYNLTPDFRLELEQRIADADSDYEKIRRLYRCLQENTRYVAIHLGIGGFQPHSAESVCANKYGDCKDLTTLMVAMVREIGLEAYPVLVKTRNGGIVYPDFPSDQFNHVIAFVLIGKDSLWIECTADNLALGELPPNDEGCQVLIIKPEGGELVRTPQSTAIQNQMMTRIEGELLNDGALIFQGSLVCEGNIAYTRRHNLIGESNEKRVEYLTDRLIGNYNPQVNLEFVEFQNVEENVELPLQGHFKGKINKFGIRSGKRIFFNPAMVHRETAGDIPLESERNFPIYCDFPFTFLDSLIIILPAGFQLEAAPDVLDLKTNFGHYVSSYTITNNILKFKRMMRIEQKLIEPEAYEEYLSFIRRAVKNDNSKFVLSRAN
ncbi:MAG: DUF3857 and transglutaminase domain-containing protein [bacterium]|nr:MAG: DUF3857 and transglutaminase domain-containing protein [bacterium]